MAAFDITTNPRSLSLKPGSTATIIVVVSNRLGRPVMALVEGVLTPASAAKWLVHPPDLQRRYEADPAATVNYEFRIAVPKDAPAQPAQFKASVRDVLAPDDTRVEGQTVGIDVTPNPVAPGPPPRSRWWIWLIVAAVVLGAALAVWLIIRPKDAEKPPVETPPVVTPPVEPPPAKEEALMGEWDLWGGAMFNRAGGRVTAYYRNDNGEINGTLTGMHLVGYWIEDSADRRCQAPRNGRYYWGKVELTFKGTDMEGKWGYCDDAPSQTATARRTDERTPPATSPSVEEEALMGEWDLWGGAIFNRAGDKVRAYYRNDKGEIYGTLTGMNLVGYWIEDSADRRCQVPRNGRYYWGRVEMRFKENDMEAKWGYCSDPPSQLVAATRIE
jgi:hypothetical protein